MLFDSSDEETEEVSLRTPDEDSSDSGDNTNLHNEVETRLGSVEETSSSSSSSSSTRTGSSGDVDLKEIKRQNEQIISLLQDIKNSGETETKDNDVGGDPTELL
ncbi:MAG: hypothetical protein ACI83Q_000777 [Colwellia polaris]|jgi:hypothetical protein